VPDLMASGKTPSQLAAEIQKRLKEFVQNPVVTVMPQSFQGPPGRQVRVIGEAVDPIAIPYRADMTLMDVMIATRGLTKFAAGNHAKLLRRVAGKQTVIPVHLSDLIRNGDISQNIPIEPGDTLIIPQSWF
jgi:polysaccharide export outer membrane protein